MRKKNSKERRKKIFPQKLRNEKRNCSENYSIFVSRNRNFKVQIILYSWKECQMKNFSFKLGKKEREKKI